MSPAQQLLELIVKHDYRRALLAFDVDGTLADFHNDPESVKMPQKTLADMKYLSQVLSLGLITGRDLDFIDRIFPGLNIYKSVEHHCEVRLPSGEIIQLVPKPDWSLIEGDILKSIPQIDEKIWLEKKKYTRTLHYREVPSDKTENVEKLLKKLGTKALQDYNQQHPDFPIALKKGSNVFELGPPQDKKMGLNHMIDTIGNKNTVPFFFGDSQADLPGGMAAKVKGGYFIGVGPDPAVKAACDIWFKDQAELRNAISAISVHIQKLQLGAGAQYRMEGPL